MQNLFQVIPPNFFNYLASNSNGAVYSDCLELIYNEYEQEISYRLPRSRIRDTLAIYLLAQLIRERINIVVCVPICAFILYSIFNLLTMLGVPSGTLQEACLGAFIILFGIIGSRNVKGVVK